MLDVARTAGDEVVQRDDVTALVEQPLAEVRPEEASAARDDRPHDSASILLRRPSLRLASGHAPRALLRAPQAPLVENRREGKRTSFTRQARIARDRTMAGRHEPRPRADGAAV